MPAALFLQAAGRLRTCPDTCTSEAALPIAAAVFLWPLAIGLAVLTAVGWNRAGRTVVAPGVMLVLLGVAAGVAAVVAAAGWADATAGDTTGGTPSPWHVVFGVGSFAVLFAAMAGLAAGLVRALRR